MIQTKGNLLKRSTPVTELTESGEGRQNAGEGGSPPSKEKRRMENGTGKRHVSGNRAESENRVAPCLSRRRQSVSFASSKMVKMIEERSELEDVNRNAVLSDATPLDSQVAGHSAKGGRGANFLSHKDGYVLKPVVEGEKGEREVRFYEELKDAADPVARELKKFVPKYFGTTKLKTEGKEADWIVLGNTSHGFAQPCVMDVKIGAQTWDPLATEEKRLSEDRKYRDCKRDCGFCIPGFQVYDLSTGELLKRDRNYGKTLNGETMKAALRTFLNGEFGLSRSLVLQFLAKLWKILRWFRTQTKYRFYSSSLLLVYDAAKLKQVFRNGVNYSRGKSEKATIGRQLSLRIATGPLTPGFAENGASRNSSCPPTPSAVEDWHTMFDNVCRTHSLVNNYEKDLQTMKENYSVVLKDLTSRSEQYEVWVNANMIDFAHVFHSNSGETDKNYLNGLQNLVDIFEEFLMEAEF